jgi:hypothetical protein
VVHSGGHKVFAGHSEKPGFIDFLERSRALAENPSLSAISAPTANAGHSRFRASGGDQSPAQIAF